MGLLLATFGTYWAIEGLGIFAVGNESLSWPGHDISLLAILAGWLLLSRVLVAALRVPPQAETPAPPVPSHADHHAREA